MKVGTPLDVTDRKLLALPQQDAQRSVTALGEELNLSRTAVHARLGRLEHDGVVLGYAAFLREPPDGGLSAIVSLRFGLRPCSLVLDRVRSWPEILHGYSTAGPTEAVLVVRVASASALSELAERLQAVPGVDNVEITLVLSTFGNIGAPSRWAVAATSVSHNRTGLLENSGHVSLISVFRPWM